MGKNQINQVLCELNDNRFFNQEYIEVKIQRKVKRVNLFRLLSYKGKIIKQSKKSNMSEFKTYMGLEKNKDCRIVGFTPNYVGVKPSKPILPQNYFSVFVSKNWDMIKAKYPNSFLAINKSLSNKRVVYEAGFDTAFEHLKENLSQSTFKYDRARVLEILQKSNYKWFNTPLISLDDPMELKRIVGYNPKSRPGMYTSLLISKKRGYSHIYSQEASLKLFENIKQYPMKNWCLWEILGREKDIKINKGDEVKEVSTRIVVSTEEHVTNLASWPAQKVQLALDIYGENNKFNLRGEFNSVKFRKLFFKRLEYDYYLAADWRFYDSNVDKTIIEISMVLILGGIIESQGRVGERIVFFMLNYQVTKYLAIPPGIVVELNKTNPSGSAFTTIANCVSNLVYWALIGYEIYGDNYGDMMDVEVYGDDAYVFFKNSDKLWYIDEIVKVIGLKSDPLVGSIKSCDIKKDMDDDHDFLKRQFNADSIQFNQVKMFDRLFYQTKKRNLDDQVALINSYITSAPFNEEINSLFLDSLLFIKKEFSSNLSRESIDSINNFEKSLEDSKKRLIINSIDDIPFNKTVKGLCYMKTQVLKREASKRIILSKQKTRLLNYIGIPVRFLNEALKSGIELVPRNLDEYDFMSLKEVSVDRLKLYAYITIESMINNYIHSVDSS